MSLKQVFILRLWAMGNFSKMRYGKFSWLWSTCQRHCFVSTNRAVL